ncbi:hypothetical protein ABI59_22550 [Acidobacteria bacterium Mor1]|nr:hypothetical protein ABI59_22550 [Acidobacteria bacterium Mor1]
MDGWRNDPAMAMADARAEGRSSLLLFSTTWCEVCRELESMLGRPRWQASLSTLERIAVDAEIRPELARQYRVHSYPTLILLSPDGRETGRRSGRLAIDELDRLVALAGRREQVVVTATRTAKLIDEAAVRTEVVTRERIEDASSRTLADAVAYTPGIRVESNCQNCNFSQVRMLGLEGAYSQILIDGVAQWSPLSMVYGIEQIPGRMIERLEVVKGGGSAIYGPGAVGGVINVLPRRPRRDGGTVELRYESVDGEPAHSASAALDLVSDDGDSYLSLMAQDDGMPGLDLSGDGFSEISRRDLTTFGLRGEHSLLAGKARVTLDLGSYRAFRRGGDRLDLPPDQAELAEEIETDRRSASLRWFHAPSQSLSYQISTTHVRTDRDTYYGAGRDPNAFGFSENPLWLLDAQVDHRRDDHTLTWGLQHQADGVIDVQPSIDRRLDRTFRNTGLFVQDDWTVNERVSLILGARADKHSELDDVIVSPRVALRFDPAESMTLRSSLSSGFRPPAVFDEDLHIDLAGGSTRSVVLAEGLREERSWTAMQGFEWVPKRGEAFWLVEANAFHTEIDDIFEEELIAPDLFEKRNLGSARVSGLELGLGYDLPRLFTVEFGWVVQRSTFGTPEADFGSDRFFRTPDQSGVLNLTLRGGRAGNAFFSVRYTGPMDVPRFRFDDTGAEIERDLIRTGSFVVVDASWRRTVSLGSGKMSLGVQVGVRNLTDEFQPDIEQGAFRDSDYIYGPRMPRSFYASTTVNF